MAAYPNLPVASPCLHGSFGRKMRHMIALHYVT